MILLSLLALAMSAGRPSPNATVTVDVENVRSAMGHIRIALCLKDQFLTNDCAYFGDAATVAGVTRVVVPNVAPGVYAVQAFHDLNDNSRVDRGAFGRPLEGVGFSNDAPIGLSGPKFRKAAFHHGEEPQTVRLTLKHFTAVDRHPR